MSRPRRVHLPAPSDTYTHPCLNPLHIMSLLHFSLHARKEGRDSDQAGSAEHVPQRVQDRKWHPARGGGAGSYPCNSSTAATSPAPALQLLLLMLLGGWHGLACRLP